VRNLVLIEGLPKTGKSSVREYVAAETGAYSVGESDLPHPIDIGWPTDRSAAIRSCRLDRYPFAAWEKLVEWLATGKRSIVMEARLCQNAACFALTAGAPAAEAIEVSARIATIVAAVEPLVIYLRPTETSSHIESILSHFDAVSRAYLAELFRGLPFAEARGITGETAFTDTVAAWATLVEQTMAHIATEPGCELLTIDDPQLDWIRTKDCAAAAARSGPLR